MLATQRLALDHRVPIAKGGQTTRSNCRIVHYRCNYLAASRLGTANRLRRRRRVLIDHPKEADGSVGTLRLLTAPADYQTRTLPP
jgi:5-methylcytosine-specific restriction endonuclease McrA